MLDKPKLAVFSDAHVAKSWDRIVEVVKDKPDILDSLKGFRTLVDIINSSSDVGAVINNGDSVDYYYSDYEGNSERGSNWDLYLEIINELNKPLFEILGNHDFRTEPYNYNFFGLEQLNIPKSILKTFKKEIGHNKFRGLDEIKSLSVNEAKFDPLQKYSGLKEPIEEIVEGYHCVFLNTGMDCFAKPKNWLKYFKKIIGARRISFDSEGLVDKDMEFVNNAIKNREDTLYIFMHTPLIDSEEIHIGEEYQLSTNDFLKSTVSQGLAYDVILNGGGKLLDKLRKTERNIVIVASHAHNAKYFLIDKNGLKTKEVALDDFNKERDNTQYIKHLTTLPIGIIHPYHTRKTGYLGITPDGFEEIVLNQF